MRYILPVLCLLGLLNQTATGQSNRTHKDTLAQTTLIKPNDIVQRIPSWDVTTTDGFTYRTNTGLYGFYGPQPTIYIDGLPVDFTFFQWQNLNMLPIAMQQIETIKYSSAPQIYASLPVQSGFMDLQTTPADSGFSAFGSLTLGNQTEDPGPWAYDSSKVTPNIDRRGPHYFGGLSYLSDNWQARVQLSLRQHQPTNLNNNHRIGSYSFVDGTWHPVKSVVTNGLADIKAHFPKGGIQSRILFSNNDEYIFFQPYGREVPAHTINRQWALQGYRLVGKWRLKGRYTVNYKDMDYRINNANYDFNWQQLRNKFTASAHYNSSLAELHTGGLLEYTNTNGLSLKSKKWIATLFGKGNFSLNTKNNLNAGASLDIAAEETAFSFSSGSNHHLANFWKLATQISYDELLYFRQNSSTYWDQLGYGVYDQLNISRALPFSSKKNQSLTVAVQNKVELSSAIDFNLEGKFYRHFALNIPWQVVSHDEEMFTGIYTRPQDLYYTSETGSRYKLTLDLNQHISPSLSHSVTFVEQRHITGSKRYLSYWHQIPKTRMLYEIKYRPFNDLSLSLATTYRGSTKWEEYQNIDGKRYRSLQPQYRIQYGTFHTRTPSFFKVDLTAKKWFWDGRFATTFSLRNLLNTEVRYHTMGPDKALKFIIKGTLKL